VIGADVFFLAAAGSLATGFHFRLEAADAAQYRDPGRSPATGVAVVLRTGPDGSRVDLLAQSNDRLPRWRWRDAGIVSASRVTLRAPAGSRALVVVRDGRGYRVDGPFPWPSEPTEREVVARPARSVRGSSPFAGAAYALRLTGWESHGDPLCESDGANEWQCVAIPRDFAGRLVACRGAAVAGTGELRPDSPADLVLRPVTFGALLQVDLSEPGSGRAAFSVRTLRPPRPKDVVTSPDLRWTVSALGNDLVWIETSSVAPEAVVEVTAAGHATKRLTILPDEVRCVEPISLVLPRATTVLGTVIDPAGTPVRSALVLVRSGAATEGGAVLGDAETDANGAFAISSVEPGLRRIRACHGEHGCIEEPAVPGVPIILRLPGEGAFVGRVLSGAGVPQAGVAVRILPTEKTWTAAEDRLTRLPLRTESGSDGRFRITAAENGDYLVEARTSSSGVARVAVRRSNLSPRVTDLGDFFLPEPIEFVARVPGCGSGTLFLSGPLGGETSLPALVSFPLDAEGSGTALLPEGGAWTAWATCSGNIEWLEPAFLPDAASLDGLEVRFARAGTTPGSQRN
jgi:hypothetical protein